MTWLEKDSWMTFKYRTHFKVCLSQVSNYDLPLLLLPAFVAGMELLDQA